MAGSNVRWTDNRSFAVFVRMSEDDPLVFVSCVAFAHSFVWSFFLVLEPPRHTRCSVEMFERASSIVAIVHEEQENEPFASPLYSAIPMAIRAKKRKGNLLKRTGQMFR